MKIVIFNVIIKHVIKIIDFDNFIVEYNDFHIPYKMNNYTIDKIL